MGDRAPVLVLGDSGWLGSHVVQALELKGTPTMGVSRAALSSPGHLQLDLGSCRSDELRALAEGTRAIVNCTDAANERNDWNFTQSELESTNIDLAHRLVEAAGAAESRPLLVHVGTILEYGDGVDRAWREADPCEPRTDYARSKLRGTQTVLSATHDQRCRAVTIRAANLIGPRPSPPTFPGKLTRTLAIAERDHNVAELIATLDERDFIDVCDVAAAIVAVIHSPTELPPLLNVSTGTARRVVEVVEEFIGISALPAHRVQLEVRELTSLGGHRTWASNELARKTLGWAPVQPLRTSLEAMWASRISLVGDT